MAAQGIFIISQLSAGIAGAGAPAGDVSGENGERYPASRPGRRRARVLWRVAGIRAEEMGWLQYLLALLLFNALGGLALFALLMLQGVLPFNPQHLPGLSWDLALNTAISFVSNTNWQAYAGAKAP